MATSTSKLGLVKPDGTDNVDIAVLNANADKIDAASGLTVCTSGTRPSVPFTGQLIYETDTDKILVFAEGNWQENRVGTSALVDSSVTTAKIADTAVTNAKLAASGLSAAKITTGTLPRAQAPTALQDSDSASNSLLLTTSYTTYATVTYVSTGRPALVTFNCIYGNPNSGAGRDFDIRVTLDNVLIGYEMALYAVFVSGVNVRAMAGNSFIITPAAGSRTVRLQLKVDTANAVEIDERTLVVVEL